jgi:hypothetical protein
VRLALTFDGLREMVRDLRDRGVHPALILVSEHEKRDLKQDILAFSTERLPVAYEADHEQAVIGFVEGCPVVSHPHMPRGKCRIIPHETARDRNHDIEAK